MLRLRKSQIAAQDLLGIWSHIAEDNPAAADRLWQKLHERFELLRKNPEMGESRDQLRPGLRAIVEGSYVIFYQPTAEEIVIFRILHGARRWEDMLTSE